MSLRTVHEIHIRRFGRNLAVALVLGAFIALVFVLTIVKVSESGFAVPAAETVEMTGIGQ